MSQKSILRIGEIRWKDKQLWSQFASLIAEKNGRSTWEEPHQKPFKKQQIPYPSDSCTVSGESTPEAKAEYFQEQQMNLGSPTVRLKITRDLCFS